MKQKKCTRNTQYVSAVGVIGSESTMRDRGTNKKDNN